MNGKVCVIIPTYNNEKTILGVISDVEKYLHDIIVVNDGCTDGTEKLLQSKGGITVVSYGSNKGKGYALKKGFEKALEMGFTHAITIDADGQHFAKDIPSFLAEYQKDENALVVGSRNLQSENMPGKNTFANKFSNFWFHLQTWQSLPDTQTGFRLYPLTKIGKCRWLTSRYEAELELLVFAAWHNVRLKPIGINVYYPSAEERVTHFRPVYDFTRISILNTVLCFLAVVYGWPMKLVHSYSS